MTLPISFNVNGEDVAADVEASAALLSVLRVQLGMTGTKEACNEGECGACTVIVDGKPVDSCIYAAADVDGRAVRTIEGLATSDAGAIVQEAFVAAGGIQCGFCTPGFIVTLTALLEQKPDADEDSVRRALAGNICRCTGYSQIVDAMAIAVNGKAKS